MKLIVNPENKNKNKNKNKNRYTFPPIGEDGKFTTPFKIPYLDINGEKKVFETRTPLVAQIIVKSKEDPLFFDYIIALLFYPDFLDEEIKRLFQYIRKENIKLVE